MRIEQNGIVIEGSVEELQAIGIGVSTRRGSNVHSVSILSVEIDREHVSVDNPFFGEENIAGRTFEFIVKFNDGMELKSEVYLPESYLRNVIYKKYDDVRDYIKELFV